MKLGIDIDGTIKQTQRAAIKVYNEEFNKNISFDEVETFYLDEPYGLGPDEGQIVWRKLESKIYTVGIPLEHAKEALQALVSEGHEVYFITARPNHGDIEEITKGWLKEHGFPYNGKNLYMNAQNKGKVAKDIGIDLFFEDDPVHINNLIDAEIPIVIVDTKYNREFGENIPRIYDWYEGLKYVHSFDNTLKSNK